MVAATWSMLCPAVNRYGISILPALCIQILDLLHPQLEYATVGGVSGGLKELLCMLAEFHEDVVRKMLATVIMVSMRVRTSSRPSKGLSGDC